MINVCDLETTGFDPKDSGVVEISCVSVGHESISFTEDGYMCSLVNPGCPIEFEAMGTHHITEEMVVNAPTLDVVIRDFGLEVHDIWCAHNAEFDSSFMPEAIRAKKWICTWRCAMHLWPDAPSHKNQALRYWLNLDVSDLPEEAGKSAHRALYDAWVTAKLLERMIGRKAYLLWGDNCGAPVEMPGGAVVLGIDMSEMGIIVDELIRLSSAPLVLKKFRFGKHKDSPIEEIPKDYLRWMLKQDFDKDVIHTVRHHLGLLV